MGRILSVLLIGLGLYWFVQNRFRIMNLVLKNRLIRRFLISSLMSLPFIRKTMMNTVFSSPNSEGSMV